MSRTWLQVISARMWTADRQLDHINISIFIEEKKTSCRTRAINIVYLTMLTVA